MPRRARHVLAASEVNSGYPFLLRTGVSDHRSDAFPEGTDALADFRHRGVVDELFHPDTSLLSDAFQAAHEVAIRVQVDAFFCKGFNGQEVFADAVSTCLVRMCEVILQQYHLLGDLPEIEFGFGQLHPVSQTTHGDSVSLGF